MNFGSGGGGGSGGGNATAAPDLPTVETEQIAFQAVSGEDKLRLLPSSWPVDGLPAPTSSLLSIASKKGLVAAAGPDTLVIASTDTIRQGLIGGSADGNKIKSYTPQATLPIPRVSQVAFSSDESCLVITAEQGGGLAVYDTNALTNGGKDAAFQLGTEGQRVRQLLPNPNPSSDLSRYFGVVTESGQLLLADLKEQKLATTSNGSAIFHERVTCACWSRLGKQIVAGLADGTAVQIDQQGVVKATIPEPPQLASWKDASAVAHPVTSIFWLETNDFLIIHTPINQAETLGNDDSIYHLAHRDKASGGWSFSKFEDPCPAFGMERKPAQHFIQRLREWLDLNDLLILSSTASADLGIFTRSKSPLNSEHPVVDSYTYTQPPDARRPAMPVSADGDTSPIGMAIDLSVKEKAPRPIPNEETLEESPVPLPALYVLNNEGLLSMWYVVYNDSVRQSQPYGDLISAGGPRALGEQKQAQPTQATSPAPSSFGASTTSVFGQAQKPAGSTFGSPSQPTSTFGKPSFGQASTPAFGGTSFLGNKPSPWGATQAGSSPAPFSQPAFGSSTFGQASGMNKSSVWGSPQQQQQQQQAPPTGSVFGGNASQTSPFLKVGNQNNTSSFGGSNTQSPFAAAAKPASGFGSFGRENQPSPFAAAASKPGLPNQTSGSTVSFGNRTSFGSGSTNFGVSGFQASPTPTPQQAQSREESMDDDAEKPASQAPSTGSGLFGLGNSGFKLDSTFKSDGTAKDDGPKPKDAGAGLFGKGFGDALGLGEKSTGSAEQKKGDAGAGGEASWLSGKGIPMIKKEPGTEDEPRLQDIPAAPSKEAEKAAPVEDAALPPEPTTKTAPVDDAPLPPDPTTWKPKPGALPPPIPPGFGSDFVKTVTKEAAPTVSSIFASSVKKQETEKEANQPLAGSPPVDLGAEKFSDRAISVPDAEEAAGPLESDDDEAEWSDEDGDEEEGEEEDEDEDEEDEENEEEDEEDEDEENRTPKVSDPRGLSAFEARLTPASPKRAEQPTPDGKESTTPATDKRDSYTPAGLPKAPVMFPPPQRAQESPRSPSPQRSATSPARSMTSKFGATQQTSSERTSLFGKPSGQQSLGQPPQLPTPSQPPAMQSPSATTPSASQPRPISSQPQRIAVPPSQIARPEKPTPPPQPAEPTQGELEDEEDARIQAILAAPVEPITEVPAFLAHQDYVADGREKQGLGGQIERVYRDVNSMIDTLALNARSLRSFVMGNSEPHRVGERGRLDLEEEDDWLLGEAGSLIGIMEGIDVELEDGRLEDVRGAIESLMEEEKVINRLRTRTLEARKQIAARSDAAQLAQQHAAPLPLESQAQQSELRQGVQRLQTLLAKAEEQLSVLRAELASVPKADGRSNAPSVEAVMNTIRKMTAMIEEKSRTVEALEAQIKRLGGPAAIGLLKPGYEDDLAATMGATRLTSPSANFRSSRASLRASRNTPPSALSKKSLFDVSAAEVEAYRLKREGRRKVMESLREQLEVRGARVVKVGL